jgi:hypothetical protein
MARSGNYDFDLDRNGIVRGAIRIVKGMGGQARKGVKVAQAELSEAGEALNMLLKQWQSEDVGLWLNKELIIFLAYQDGKYSLGPSGDHATLAMIETELSSSSAASDTTLTVDSITGITSGDAIGIELDANTLQWTTVNGAPSGSTVTITAGLTSTAGIDNNVYTYTTMSQRPLEITSANLVRDAGNETPLHIATRQEWNEIAKKNVDGVPSQIYYDPQLDSGILYVWTRPSTTDMYIKARAKMPIQDLDAAVDDPDFPPECHRAVKFNLAIDLCHEYTGIDMNRYYAVNRQAVQALNVVKQFNADFRSYTFEASDD